MRPLGALPPPPRRAVAKPSPRTLQVSLLLASSCRPARATYLAAGEGEKDAVEPRPEVSSALPWTCWVQIVGGLVLNAYEPDTALHKSLQMFKLHLLLDCTQFGQLRQALVRVRIHGSASTRQKVPGLPANMKQVGIFPRGDCLYFAFRLRRLIAII